MHYTTAILCLVSLAQITSTIPDGTTIFTITIKDGRDQRVVSAAIKARGEFIDSYDAGTAPSQLELVLDEPWNYYPTLSVTRLNIEEVVVEASFKRKERREGSGYVPVETERGEIWVLSETAQRYERMLELQSALEAQRASDYSAAVLESNGEQAQPSGPGPVQQWGRHVVVLVLAAVSLVVVFRVFL